MGELTSQVKLFTMFRLGLFQMGLGIMSLLTLGVINRVMIDELKVPALIASGAIAAHQFVSPARVWFGQLSDTKPLFGLHRTGYIWLGTLLFTATSFLALQVVWQLGNSAASVGWSPVTYGWAALLAIVFIFYGLALSASSTPFAALLFDVSDDRNRSPLISIVWSMLMVGIIVGAIISSILLKKVGLDSPPEDLQASINRLFIIVPSFVCVLTVIGTAGVEQRFSLFGDRISPANRDDKITFGSALKILTASRQTAIFFTFLLFMSTSLFMQDPVLEPYGGEVFQMAISETTQLNAFFGTGTLIGIGATGFLIIPYLGKQRTCFTGCIATALCSGLLLFSGFTGNPKALMVSLLLFGLSSGILTAGSINLMLDLTAAETAGTFIGAWGLAQAMARGGATILGGAVLDLGKILFSLPQLSYGLVFLVQALGLVSATILLRRVNIREFQENAKEAIALVMESDLD
ncbi:BCD family MFS transporter [Roseofilum casamattae]|uniref:BCD family MFS transporter n=1 Tax=Roseofilum casamattae BLCC-M143 TaxID=3022442 RepID=A0ABT7BVX6_9CYAN|nr:BCD family MFS transporter [Roseofilum casamattae]MDJ1182962.1 BCD family MFS transporter [Roseofilum casamattae BLCC-M143]